MRGLKKNDITNIFVQRIRRHRFSCALVCVGKGCNMDTIKKVKVNINNNIKEYPVNTRLLDIAKEYQGDYEHDIILAFIDGKLRELFKTVERDCTVSFVTTADNAGHKTYTRGMILVLLKAPNQPSLYLVERVAKILHRVEQVVKLNYKRYPKESIVIALEGFSYGSKGRSVFDIGYLGWRIREIGRAHV